jgi:hypothetical protein
MRKAILAGVALVGLAVLGGSWAQTATAQDKDHGKASDKACFFARDVWSFAPVGRDAVNIRVHANDVYQLTLLGDCPNVDWDNGVGLQNRSGSGWICSSLDAEIIAPQPGGIPAMHCPVRSIRKLSKEEAAALPPKQHP